MECGVGWGGTWEEWERWEGGFGFWQWFGWLGCVDGWVVWMGGLGGVDGSDGVDGLDGVDVDVDRSFYGSYLVAEVGGDKGTGVEFDGTVASAIVGVLGGKDSEGGVRLVG